MGRGGWIGGLRPQNWAPTTLPSCFPSQLSGWMGGPRPRSWALTGLPSCSFLNCCVGWVGRGHGGWASTGLPSCSFLGLGRMGGPRPRGCAFTGLLSCSFLGWMGGPRPRGWAFTGLPSSPCKAFMFLSRLLGRMGGPRPRGWASAGLPSCSFLGSWVGGWAAATGLGSMFLSRVLGRMGGPRPRGWACAGLPSCSFLGLGRVGGPRPRGWALTGLLSCSFLGSWVGWVGRGHSVPFSARMGRPRQEGWAPKRPPFIPGCWVGWAGRGQEAALLFGCQEAGLPAAWSDGCASNLGFHWACGSDGWAAARKLGFVGLPSCCFLCGSRPRSWACIGLLIFPFWALLGRMGRPRPRSWAPFIFGWVGWGGLRPTSWVCWGPASAAARKLGSRWAPFILPSFWVLGRMGGPRQKGWALRAPFIFRLWVGWVGCGQDAGLALGSLHPF